MLFGSTFCTYSVLGYDFLPQIKIMETLPKFRNFLYIHLVSLIVKLLLEFYIFHFFQRSFINVAQNLKSKLDIINCNLQHHGFLPLTPINLELG